MTRLIMAAVLVLGCSDTVHASQSPHPMPGTLTQRVACQNQEEQSYAVYLPTAYDDGKPWPVLICFDPAARGALPVSLFRRAAEVFGYIVVGSNNSRNFVRNASFDAINAIWPDINRRFTIDQKRIYLAGFSGGARASCNIANLNRNVVGVIACGAGFGYHFPPEATRGFAVFGIVGTLDQNYLEMMQLDQTLERLSHRYHLTVFDGAHVWPPEDLLFEGVAWFELLAMRSGLLPVQPQEIHRQYVMAITRAQDAERNGRWAEVFRLYTGIKRDFDGLLDLGAVERRLGQLKDDAQVKDALKDRKKLQREEDRQIEVFRQRFSRLHRMALKPSWIKKEKMWWEERVGQLNQIIAQDASPQRCSMAQRLLTLIRSTSVEETMRTLLLDDPTRAVLAGEVAATLNPEHAVVHYNLACAYARKGKLDAAMETLAKSLALGYRDGRFIQQDPDLEPLADDPRFQDLLDTLLRESPPAPEPPAAPNDASNHDPHG